MDAVVGAGGTVGTLARTNQRTEIGAMNWDAVGAVAEVVGAAGVLITLVYLAVQIRHNSASVDASTEDGVTSGFNDVNNVIAADAELARIFTAGLEDPESLSDEEAVRFSFLFSSYVNQYNRLLVLNRKGSFPDDRWIPYAQELAVLVASPGGALWRAGNPHFADLWTAVDEVETESGIDMKLMRDDGRETSV